MIQNDSLNEENLAGKDPVLAAQYVRMSTDHQQYSTLNQADKIKEYANKHNIKIIKTYQDDGKSGLNIHGRCGLQQLIHDVQEGEVAFSQILVYDISRWGRFQDSDESAYYEYICKKAGIQIIYCAEQFNNDGSPISTIVKSIKRTMAGEYSRELSSKVFAGQCRLIELGYRQGGPAGFGLRRALLDPQGNLKNELLRGEQKSFQMDRVILVPGPEDEIQVVNNIYHWFVEQRLTERGIAEKLNQQAILTDLGRPWSRGTVHEVLTNEKYIGNNVYNRRSFKLKKARVSNPKAMWIRKENAFESIVPLNLFYTAQGIIQERSYRFSDNELLACLKDLYQKHGYLSGIIINESNHSPTTSVYAHRFGSLIRAYQLVGFTPDRDYQYIEINKFLRRLHPEIVKKTEQEVIRLGGTITYDSLSDLLVVNGEFSLSIVLTRCQKLASGNHRWKVRFDTGLSPDITVVVRLNDMNTEIQDYYLLPGLDFMQRKLSLAEYNPIELESYRFDNLNFLYSMAERAKWKKTI